MSARKVHREVERLDQAQSRTTRGAYTSEQSTMSQGESQLSHIIDAAERWANETDEHSAEEHAGQITYLRELVESAMGEQGNSLPMHLLRSGIMRT